MNDVPAISVLLPVYNGEAYLAETLASVLEQSFADFELIAIDDGSTDGSLSILQSFDDSRMRIVSRENCGLVATLNGGLKMARAPLIARMDADDVMLPDRLALQKAHMDAHPACVALGSAIIFIDAQGRRGETRIYPRGPELARRMREEGSMLAHPAVMLRRDAALAAGGYRQAFAHCEDYDLWLRLLECGEIDNLPEPLLLYRQHGGQVSTKQAIVQAVCTEVARELAAMRISGDEPGWDSATPIAPDNLAKLPLPSASLARAHEAGLRACLRPGLLNAPAQRRQMRQLLRGLIWTMPQRLAEDGIQHLLWALAASSWRSGGYADAARLAWAVLRADPAGALRSLLSKLSHAAWRLKSRLAAA